MYYVLGGGGRTVMSMGMSLSVGAPLQSTLYLRPHSKTYLSRPKRRAFGERGHTQPPRIPQ